MPNRKVAAKTAKRKKAEAGNAKQIGAPMPGVIGSVAVKEGQRVKAGTKLFTIEAMKMESAINAEADGRIAAIHVAAGDQIDAKDLLLEFK
ncbi:biotin/lipoyl-binding protein [Maricaulaceae bacterium NA33B04]|nr:biotin/lipoyl-binding protein [Maricaulaceae bacterium NA33B04]